MINNLCLFVYPLFLPYFTAILYFGKPKSLEQEVPEIVETKIESFEIDSAGKITVKLNRDEKDARFLLNGTVVKATPGADNTYTIAAADTSSLLKKNGEENTLVVTDEHNTFEQEKTFVYRTLVAPKTVNVAAESRNEEDEINSSNVKDVGIAVELEGENIYEDSVAILVVKVEDSEGNVLELSKPLAKGIIRDVIRGDLSSLEEGSLTLTAYVKDNEGNVSDTETGSATKFANAPVVTYEGVTRGSSNRKITIKNLDSTNGTSDTIYYLVKGIEDEVPTVNEIIGNGAGSNKITISNSVIWLPDNEFVDEAHVIYLAARTQSGTNSEEVVAVKVAKTSADVMKDSEGNTLTIALQKVASTNAKYTWKFDEEAEGFVEYKVTLKDPNGKIVYEETIKAGEPREIDFFDVLKKQEVEGQYTAIVTAVADNVNYKNVVSTPVIVTDMKNVLTKIAITLDKENKKITWTPTGDVTNISGYTVEVLKYDSTKTNKEYETVVASANMGSALEYDFSSVVAQNGAGTYGFKVTANAKENVLMLNTSSADVKKADSNPKYHQGVAINDLSVSIENGKVMLDATKLDEAKLYDGTANVTYSLYYKANNGEYAENNKNNVAAFPHEVSSLNPGTEYTFMVVTNVDGNKYSSNEVSVTTPLTTLVLNNAKYKKPEEGSQILPSLLANEITYKDGILYVGTTMTQYSEDDYPVVAKIASVLDQMGKDDTISVNGDITALTLTASATKATAYDLSKLPATAKVEITGQTSYKTTVKGSLNEITLNNATQFDLSELTVAKINVNAAAELTLNSAKATVNFTGTTATVNSVKLTQSTALPTVTVEGDTFTVTGSTNALEIDASEVEKDVNVEFVGTNQNGLIITANENNAVKVLTNEQEIKGLAVKSGKVDVSDAVFTSLVVGDNTASTTKTVTLVTNKSNTGSAVVGGKITTTPTILDWLGYYLTASEDDEATYSVGATGSKEIVFTLNSSATVTLNQKSEELTANKTNSVDKTPMKDDTYSNEYTQNMDAIESVTVDSNTNTITVKVNNNMKKYKDNHAYYTLLIDVGVPRENLETGTDKGQEYYEIKAEDITASEAYGAGPTEVLVWLYAEDAKSIVDFVTTTGEHLYFTVIVEGYVEE